MTTITNNVKKQLTLNNEIKVNDVIVKGQQAIISEDGNKISFTDWCNNMELYKTNKIEIRKKEAEFEDYAFEEQTKLKESVALLLKA